MAARAQCGEGVDVWKKLKGLTECVFGGILEIVGVFSNLVSFNVGDGSCIRFWHVVWCGEVALKYSFPKVYSIARNKETLVSNYLDSSDSCILWNLRSLDSFLDLLYSLKTHLREVDRKL